jgi:multiple sugar transport system substrate-binding protein
MVHQDDGGVSRRNALKTLGGTAGIGMLAGCIGGDSSSGGGGEKVGNKSSSKNANGVTIELWNTVNGQSEVAANYLTELQRKYEQQTGNTLKLVNDNVASVQKGNWLTRMNQGKVPTLFQCAGSRSGQFVENGFVTPWGTVIDQFNSKIINGTEWAHDTVRDMYQGFEKPKMKTMMLGFVMQEPFIARADHFEKAGLDIEKDYPPKNYDELIDLAKTLQKEGPGKYGFQVHGAPGDLMDEITPTWAHTYGGVDGMYINSDWTDVNYDKKPWKTSLSRQVEIYRELDLSSPNADSTSDEDACNLLIDGKASMSMVGMLNYGLLASRAPKMLKNGTLRFGSNWEGKSGFRGEYNNTVIGLGSKPPGMADSTWEKKKQAGIKFMEFVMSVEVQKDIFKKFGLLPFNRKAWDKIPPKKNKIVDVATTLAKNSKYAWSAHPQMGDIQYNIPGPIFQRAMNGTLTPEEACNQAASRVRRQVFRR